MGPFPRAALNERGATRLDFGRRRQTAVYWRRLGRISRSAPSLTPSPRSAAFFRILLQASLPASAHGVVAQLLASTAERSRKLLQTFVGPGIAH
jgi:hypothetical protein